MESLRKKDKRSRILDSAFKLFRKQGVNATGLNEILAESHTGKSQIYHYFGNKQNLVREVLQAYAERVLLDTAEFMNHIETLDDFEKLIDGSVKLAQTSNEVCGCLAGSVLAEVSLTDEIIRVEIVHIFERWKNLFSKGLVRLQAKGLLRQDANPDRLAEYFLITMQGAFLMARATKNLDFVRKSMLQAIQYIRSFEPPKKS